MRRGFTLIELIVVIVILGIVAAIAVPKYFDLGDEAKDAADESSLGGIHTALMLEFTRHRMDQAPSSDWVTSVNDLPSLMATGQLPQGMSIVGTDLVDQRGNTYTLTPETVVRAAYLEPSP